MSAVKSFSDRSDISHFHSALLGNLQGAVSHLTYDTYRRCADVLCDAALEYAENHCVDRFNAMNNTGAYRHALYSRARFICNAFDPYNATAPYATILFHEALGLPITPWEKLRYEQRAALDGKSLLRDIDEETLRRALTVFAVIDELDVDPRYAEYSADRAARISGVQRTISKLYTCGKCRGKESYIRTIIIRSQDEGYNKELRCVNCNHRWIM